jgi:ferredoxin
MDDEGKAFPTKDTKQSGEIDDAIMACPVNAIHYKD